MKTLTKALVLVAMVLGLGALVFSAHAGTAPWKTSAGRSVWNPGRVAPAVHNPEAARIAELPPSLLTQARW